MNSSSPAFGLREILATLFRHKVLILGLAIAAAFASLAFALLQSKVWESSVRIVVQQNRQSIKVGPGETSPDASFSLNRSEQVRTEMQIMSSPAVLAKAAELLGPELVLEKTRWRWDWLRELPGKVTDAVRGFVMQTLLGRPAGQPLSPLQLAIRRIDAHLSVEPIRESAVFSITVNSPDPEFSARLLDALVQTYLEHHVKVRQGAVGSGVFAAEADRLRAELAAAIEQEQRMKAEAGIVLPGTQKQLLLQRLSDAEAALQRGRIEALETERRIAEAERQLAQRQPNVAVQSTVTRNPEIDTLRQQLSQLELERAGYQPGSAAARALDVEIDALRTRLRSEQERVVGTQVSGPNTTYQEIERNLLADRARLRALSSRHELAAQIERYRNELGKLDGHSAELRELTRQVELKEEALRASLRKQEEERLSGLLNDRRVSDVVPIEPAMPADRPARPKAAMSALLGLGTGLLAGLGLAFLIEYMRRTIRTREEAAAQLGQRVLASIVDTDRVAASAALNQIELRHVAEALRYEVAQHTASHGGRGLTVLVTSTVRGEGKTMLTRELARIVGRNETECLVVDAPAGRLNLGAGPIPREPGVVSAAGVDEARAALQSLAERCRLVLIDGPALGSEGEGLWLPEIVDRVVLVLEADRTTGFNAMRTLRLIEGAGGQVAGVVLNRRRFDIPGWVYGWLLSPREAMRP